MTDAPTPEAIAAGLVFLDSLSRTECSAFLGLFAGAQSQWHAFDDDRTPFMGKHECQMVDDWRDFYGVRLKAAGLVTFEELESGPAPGMVRKANGDLHTWTKIECRPTGLGFDVREAWWARLNARAAARDD